MSLNRYFKLILRALMSISILIIAGTSCTAQVKDSLEVVLKPVETNKPNKPKRKTILNWNFKQPTVIFFGTKTWRDCYGPYDNSIFYDDDSVATIRISKVVRRRRYTDVVTDTVYTIPNFDIRVFVREFKALTNLDFSQSIDGFLDGDREWIEVTEGGVGLSISVHCAEERLSDPNIKRFFDLYTQLAKLTNISK